MILGVFLAFFSASIFAQNMVPDGLVILDPNSNAIVVNKEGRTLSVWTNSNNTLKKISEYPTDIGKVGGNKSKLGDHRTPEGVYFFSEKYSGPTLDYNLYGSQAFATNYPNHFDSIDGKTGSGIWLHAIPDTVPLTRGSRGCVVVRENTLKEIAPNIKLEGTPILIFGTINYVPEESLAKDRTEVSQWMDEWKSAWESKNIDKYISYYHEDFEGLGMNTKQWKKYKTGLIEKYEFIKLNFANYQIYRHKDDYLVRFNQTYTSDKFSDFGFKTLYLRKANSRLQILGEEFTPIKNN